MHRVSRARRLRYGGIVDLRCGLRGRPIVDDYVGVKAIAPSIALGRTEWLRPRLVAGVYGRFFLYRRLSFDAVGPGDEFRPRSAGRTVARRRVGPRLPQAFASSSFRGASSWPRRRSVWRLSFKSPWEPFACRSTLWQFHAGVPVGVCGRSDRDGARRSVRRRSRAATGRHHTVNDGAEKPFEATPRRIARAKREGNVARAGELAANCGFAAAALSVSASAPAFAALTAGGADALDARTGAGALRGDRRRRVAAASPAPRLAARLRSLITQGGFTFVAPAWKFERLDPIEGLKRIVSRETLTHSLRATVAFCCAVAVMAPMLRAASSERPHRGPPAAWLPKRGRTRATQPSSRALSASSSRSQSSARRAKLGCTNCA